MTHRGALPWIIGRNYHPGITPGGFSEPFPKSNCESTKTTRPCASMRDHRAIREAASVVLEGRQMVRAEEAQQL